MDARLVDFLAGAAELNSGWSEFKKVRTWPSGAHGKITGLQGSGKTVLGVYMALLLMERSRLFKEEFWVMHSGFMNTKLFPRVFDESNMLDIIADESLPPKLMLGDEFNTLISAAFGQSHHTQRAKDKLGMARKTGTSLVGLHVPGQSTLSLLDHLKRWEMITTAQWETPWIAPGGGRKGSFCPAWKNHPTHPWKPAEGTTARDVELQYLQHSGGPIDPKTGRRMGPFRSCLTFSGRFDVNYYLRIRRKGTDDWFQCPCTLCCAQRLFPFYDTTAQQDSAYETQSRAAMEKRSRNYHRQVMIAVRKYVNEPYWYSLDHMIPQMMQVWDEESGIEFDADVLKSLLRQHKQGNPDAVAKPKPRKRVKAKNGCSV